MTRGAFGGVLPATTRQVQRLSLIRPADFAGDTPVDTAEPVDAEVCALDEIAPAEGFVLLGESGMGKTTALAQLRAAWEAAGSFDHVVDVNLELVRDPATFDVLITSELKQCFQNVAASDEDVASRARSRVLLVLDHTDRCALGSLLFGKLMERLAGAPETRGFTLLTACRDTDWPVELSEQLRRAMPGLEGARLLPEVLLWATGRSMTGDGLTVRQGARRSAELCDKLIARAWAVNERAPCFPLWPNSCRVNIRRCHPRQRGIGGTVRGRSRPGRMPAPR